VNGSGISWVICKSAPRSRQITTPTPHHSVFTGRMLFLPPNQRRQSLQVDLYNGCKMVVVVVVVVVVTSNNFGNASVSIQKYNFFTSLLNYLQCK